MVVTIKGADYECRTATKEGNTVTLYLGEYDENGVEKTSVFIDFKDEDIVGIEDASEPTADEILNAMLGVNRYA